MKGPSDFEVARLRFIPELFSSCTVADSKKRIADAASTIHIDAFTSSLNKREEDEHEELLYDSTRAVLATTTNTVSGTLAACEIVFRHYFSNSEKKISLSTSRIVAR